MRVYRVEVAQNDSSHPYDSWNLKAENFAYLMVIAMGKIAEISNIVNGVQDTGFSLRIIRIEELFVLDN